MKIFEVAGEGKLHGLTVMSLDTFVNKEDDVEESDMSGIMHAARNYNKSFLITAELAEGGKKTFRVRAQSERVAREKFAQHHNQATIISVKEEGVEEAKNSAGIGWMLKADPALGAAVKKKQEIARARRRSYGDPKAGKSFNDNPNDDWSAEFERRMKSGSLKEEGVDEGIKGAVAGGIAGGAFTKSVKGAMTGAQVGSEIEDFVGKFTKPTATTKPTGYTSQFKSKEEAVAYAKEAVKKFRDPEDGNEIWAMPDGGFDVVATMNSNGRNHTIQNGGKKIGTIGPRYNGIAEAPGDFGLGANYRAIPDDEMQALMGRSKNKAKTKRDKYDYPYIHGSNIEVKDESGRTFDTEKLKAAIMTRPERILGQNAKMQHSETGTEAIFDIGLPALKGLAVNEKTGEFVVVDTCPGAGACQTYCYAMKGSYVMFKAVSMGLARMLNFLLNDPAGFASKLNQEIASARSKYAKKGARIVVRWHDAGDFFSPEYLAMAYSVAEANPDVGFYAYTKMGDVANAARPKNFNMNFSQGAKTGQEKKVNITRTKHSKVVPKDMFFDLIARKGNELIKDAKGRMQFASPENLEKFKTIMAQKYAIDKNSILTYDQMMKTPVGEEPKWNVIVMPGDGDNSANRNDVIGSYLLFH